jgi:predicted XRE-type DNA-binding protein
MSRRAIVAAAVEVLHRARSRPSATDLKGGRLARCKAFRGPDAMYRFGYTALMKTEVYENVWEALCDTRGEVANLTLRSTLMSAVQNRMRDWKVTEGEAAKRLGLTRPRLDELMGGKLEKFSLDALVNIATAAGFKLGIQLEDDA